MLPKNFTQEGGTSRYLLSKLKSGQKVKFRVMGDFVMGKSVWGEKDGKPYPYRFKMGENVPVKCIGFNDMTNKPNQIHQFLAAVVWNYSTEQFEVLEVNKKSIIGQIVELENNEDWGDTKGYDLTLSRTGSGFADTKYTLLPSNKTKGMFTDSWKTINLSELFTGGDPFASEQRGGNEPVLSDEETDQVIDDIPF